MSMVVSARNITLAMRKSQGMLEPVLDELANQNAGRIKFAKVNVDESPKTASEHGIRGVPALYFYNRGKIVDQAVGALPKAEIERRLNTIVR
jgi:thioredoxin 1